MTDTSQAYKLTAMSSTMGYKHRSVGAFVEWYLEYHDISERVLAEKLGIHQPYISIIKKDEMAQPTEFCKKLYEILSAQEKKMLMDAYSSMAQDYFEGKRGRGKK